MSVVLGVDPGNNGAAVLVNGKQLLAVAAWKARTRGGRKQYLVRCTTPGAAIETPFTARTAHGVGRATFRYMRNSVPSMWTLVVEDAYVRQNIKTSVIMARWAGAVSGPLEDYAIGPAQWSKASVWRKTVLGMSPWTKRGKAKEAAQLWIPKMLTGSESLPAIAKRLELPLEHLTDAAGIALSVSTGAK